MDFKKIITLEKELNFQLQMHDKEVQITLASTAEQLRAMLLEEQRGTLLIAATDATIALGKEYGVATMAYMNPDFPNQTYSGVDMIVEGFEEVDTFFLEKVYQRYHHIPWKIAETSRCIIRELSLEDLRKAVSWMKWSLERLLRTK